MSTTITLRRVSAAEARAITDDSDLAFGAEDLDPDLLSDEVRRGFTQPYPAWIQQALPPSARRQIESFQARFAAPRVRSPEEARRAPRQPREDRVELDPLAWEDATGPLRLAVHGGRPLTDDGEVRLLDPAEVARLAPRLVADRPDAAEVVALFVAAAANGEAVVITVV